MTPEALGANECRSDGRHVNCFSFFDGTGGNTKDNDSVLSFLPSVPFSPLFCFKFSRVVTDHHYLSLVGRAT